MHLPPWPLSFVFPLCPRIGSSAHSTLITPSADNAALYGHALAGHDDFRVNLTRNKPIATALQQKVSD